MQYCCAFYFSLVLSTAEGSKPLTASRMAVGEGLVSVAKGAKSSISFQYYKIVVLNYLHCIGEDN
jgi:hypothetical protein